MEDTQIPIHADSAKRQARTSHHILCEYYSVYRIRNQVYGKHFIMLNTICPLRKKKVGRVGGQEHAKYIKSFKQRYGLLTQLIITKKNCGITIDAEISYKDFLIDQEYKPKETSGICQYVKCTEQISISFSYFLVKPTCMLCTSAQKYCNCQAAHRRMTQSQQYCKNLQ